MTDATPATTTGPVAAEDVARPSDPAVRRPRWQGGRAVVVLWLAAHAVTLALLLTLERAAGNDVFYYWRHVSTLGAVGLPGTLREYPTPVVWLLLLPTLPGGGRAVYAAGFLALMLALDALLTYLLWRAAGRRRDRAVDVWLVFVLLLGPVSLTRFDMVPAVLVAGALLAARTRPRLAGALIGLGAAIKLWPALLVGAFAAPRAGRGPLLVGFVVVGVGLAVLSLVAGGVRRLFSPLAWQSGRGLQDESVWASPLLVARLADPTRWQARNSAYQAVELFGPGVATWLVVSTVVTVLGLVVVVALAVRAFRHPDVGVLALGLVTLATIAVTIVSSKTLSPQYVLWLGGPLVVLVLHRSSRGDRWRRVVDRLTLQLLVLAVPTHLLFPLLFPALLDRRGTTLLVVATLVVVLRNLLLVALTVQACFYAWRALDPPREPGVVPG